MRVGGPADLFAVAHNAFELRGARAFARSRGLPPRCSAGAATSSSPTPGSAAWSSRTAPRESRIDGDRLRRRGRPADGPGRHRDPARRACPASSSGWRSRARVGGAVWANAGAHGADVAAVLESADVLLADGTEAACPPPSSGSRYRESRFKASRAGRDREVVVLGATFRLEPADPADDQGAARRHPALAPGAPAARASRAPAASFRNPPDGPSAGALIDAAGLKGTRIGGATRQPEKHANFIVNDRQGDRRRRPPPRRAGPGRGRAASSARASCSRSCSSATGAAGTGRTARRRRRPRR